MTKKERAPPRRPRGETSPGVWSGLAIAVWLRVLVKMSMCPQITGPPFPVHTLRLPGPLRPVTFTGDLRLAQSWGSEAKQHPPGSYSEVRPTPFPHPLPHPPPPGLSGGKLRRLKKGSWDGTKAGPPNKKKEHTAPTFSYLAPHWGHLGSPEIWLT